MIGILASSPHPDLLVLAWQLYVVGVDSWTWWYLTRSHFEHDFSTKRHHLHASVSPYLKSIVPTC